MISHSVIVIFVYTVLYTAGKPIEIDCSNQVVTPNTIKILKGKGMPITKRPGQFGDLRVEFNIQFPKGPLSEHQKQKIKEANLQY